MKRYIVAFMLISIVMMAGLLVGGPAHTNAAGKPEAEIVLDQMETVGNKLTSLTASLWQQKDNKQVGFLDKPEIGTIHYVPAKTGTMKLRIDITQPSEKTIVINGDKLKFYERNVNQMLVTSLKEGKGKSVGSLAITFGSVAAMRTNYTVTFILCPNRPVVIKRSISGSRAASACPCNSALSKRMEMYLRYVFLI
jgi:outer membrane lipoprotein-sorting protein